MPPESNRNRPRKPLDLDHLRLSLGKKSISAMGRESGVSASTVRRRLDRAGILSMEEKLRKPNGSQELAKEIRRRNALARAEERARIAQEKQTKRFPLIVWEEQVKQGQIYGEKGKLTSSENGKKIQCHLCGNFFRWLSPNHTKTHGLTLNQYRELLGLNRRQSFYCPDLKASRRQWAIDTRRILNVLHLRKSFKSGDPRFKERGGASRLQHRMAISESLNAKRARGEPIRSSKLGDSHQRRVNPKDGAFSLFGARYPFNKEVTTVTIEILGDNQFKATGSLRNGKLLTEMYYRVR